MRSPYPGISTNPCPAPVKHRICIANAAVVGGRIYLAAYGHGLGATGLTFFDDLVTEFFSPHAAGKGVMFLTAVGRATQRSRRR